MPSRPANDDRLFPMIMHPLAGQTHRCVDFKKDVVERLVAQVEKHMRELVHVTRTQDNQTASTSGRAAEYHLDSGGQRVRARIAVNAGVALGLLHHDIVVMAATAELLHNASLIHDDLQDRDEFRRGRRTTWSVFGPQIAICAGDLLLSAAYGSLAALQDTSKLARLLQLVHARTAFVIKGQSADLAAQTTEICDVDTYAVIAAEKSGALLILPLELVLVAAGQETSADIGRKAAEALAIGYQIIDDLADLESDRGVAGKPPGLNIVIVLEAAGYGSGAVAAARKLGIKHLESAASAADFLPKKSGRFLHEMALKLLAIL